MVKTNLVLLLNGLAILMVGRPNGLVGNSDIEGDRKADGQLPVVVG